MFRIISLLVSLFILLPVTAQADTITVRANKTSAIGGFWVFGKQNCHHPGKIDHRVARKPEHGKIVVSFEKRRIPKSVSAKCAGRMSGAMVVRYTPDRGYRGKDRASVTFIFPRYQGGYGTNKARTTKYSLVVK